MENCNSSTALYPFRSSYDLFNEYSEIKKDGTRFILDILFDKTEPNELYLVLYWPKEDRQRRDGIFQEICALKVLRKLKKI
jgi:hypothetical protein